MEPTKEQYEKYTSDFCDFSHKSPDPFHAAKNAADILENRGFTRLYENESWKLCRGGSYYFLRNDCCLIAFKLPKETEEQIAERARASKFSPATATPPPLR